MKRSKSGEQSGLGSRLGVVVLGLLALQASNAPAATRTWTGAGDWHADAANWSGSTVPQNGDDVVIAGAVTLTNSTAELTSYLLNAGRTHTFGGTNTILRAASATVYGTVVHNVNTDTNAPWEPDNLVWIACSNLMVATNGLIHGDSKGYAGGTTTHTSGYGPGAGIHSGARGGGGGYGGAGGRGDDAAALGGNPYGSATLPADPGSGGGNGNGGDPDGYRGGGLIRLEASGRVAVNGTIRANGQSSSGGGGGGSGGGIYIVCNTFAGTNGWVQANGGDGLSVYSGGGGGGRIALVYNTAAQSALNQTSRPGVYFEATCGVWSRGDGSDYARPGSLYFSDTNVIDGTRLKGGELLGFTAWTPQTLTIDHGLAVVSNMNLTVAGDATVRQTGGLEIDQLAFTVGGSLTIDGANLTANPGRVIFSGGPVTSSWVHVGGDLVVTNAGKFRVYAVPTNEATPYYGALVTVDGDTYIMGTNSWIYPCSQATNGGSAAFRMRDLTIALTSSGFDANTSGYGAGTAGHPIGYGPGGGSTTGDRGGGGGYGGIGGNGREGSSTTPWGGPTYGSADAPAEPGSGGGYGNGGPGHGGGLIRLELNGRATLNGTLRADGGNATSGGGGGSGGGIYLTCRTLYGTNAVLTARGGNGLLSPPYYSASGGGGRIAVWSINDASSTQTWTIAVNGGASGTPGSPGAVGTVVWGRIPPKGSVVTVR